ncbi:glycosyltransferase family 4 protein [Thermostichus vulcanus]|uniref:Glycosyltransferase family 4 protein n=1 Tax=Thermostichus vulcanus str. 'Rupite' TaxID=2813851 RepID=A0ABT0C6B6_THEVL|nr:glycosyltransferase family 4 protein [Thermostichus vulcanus]MCJ2541343.1 glycosyltransferase family 4 protein [Thermostichus vulcanus str. 'Rupite']
MHMTPLHSKPIRLTEKKYRVLHVVKDDKMGGVKSNLQGFINSDLSYYFDFEIVIFDVEKLRLHSFQGLTEPDLIVYHPTCRLKGLPDLLRLKTRFPKAKLIIHEHAYSQEYEKHNVPQVWRFRNILRVFYRLANQVVAISQSQADWMLKNHLVLPHQLRLIHQCPPLDRFTKLSPKSRKGDLILGAYGRFCTQKGFKVLIQAMEQVPDLPIRLLLGGSGELERSLHQMARHLSSVTFLGQVEDVPGFLERCDAVVIPSLWEPWGNVCLEARAAGKPIIASQVDGLVEQVQNPEGECGLLVTPNNPTELAKGIRIMTLASPWQLRKWGETGKLSTRGGHHNYLQSWKELMCEVLH